MICMGEASRRDAMRCSLNHCHAERHHQGLDKALIAPEPEVGRPSGRVKRRKHLGGLQSYDHREAASMVLADIQLLYFQSSTVAKIFNITR
jgi:hypothetical protein